MAKWEELPIVDRAEYMKIAVKNGYRDIRSIKEAYNQYAKGGPKEDNTREQCKTYENNVKKTKKEALYELFCLA